MSAFEDKLKDVAEKGKKQIVSIPNGAIVKALLTSIKYTNAGKEAASIVAGIGVSFSYLGYYKDKEMKEYITTVDYSNLDNILFPQDVMNADGTTEYVGIMSKPVYLTPGVLKGSRHKMVSADIGDEQTQALYYAKIFGDEMGAGMSEPFIHCLAGSGLCKLDALEMGLDKFNTTFPIAHFWRNTDWVYDKKDVDEASGKPKEGAKKKFTEYLNVHEKGLKWDDPERDKISLIPIEFVDANTAIKIIDAINARQEKKKLESGVVDTPF